MLQGGGDDDDEKPAWLECLYVQKFFGACSIHDRAKKNEKNIYCLDCCTSICPHCVFSHKSHRLLQIRRYVYHEVVRLEDLHKLMDCSNIQAYTINAAKVVFINKRSLRQNSRHFKASGNYCTSCHRTLQQPFIHCSLACKVDFVLKHYKDLSPFLRICNTLQLGPDFFTPQDIGDEEDDDTTNETPNSTIDGPLSSYSGSSCSENMMSFSCTEIVRKKRSGLYVCGRILSSTKIITEEDNMNMATSMCRRKGIPHRSPLC